MKHSTTERYTQTHRRNYSACAVPCLFIVTLILQFAAPRELRCLGEKSNQRIETLFSSPILEQQESCLRHKIIK
eukprot:5516265-Pleurochrysis_carterae.AAC.1